MTDLPEWWNDLMSWFLATRSKRLPTNMGHAWRVNRYADSVCNGGLADYLASNAKELPQLRISLLALNMPEQVKLLDAAIDFRAKSRSKRRLPKVAFVPRGVAYDCLFRGWSSEKTQSLLAEMFPECPPQLYPAILEVAAGEVAALAGWERLDRQFWDGERQLRLGIAQFAEQHLTEWTQ